MKKRIIVITVLVITAAVIAAVFTMPFNINREVKMMGNLMITSNAFENKGIIPKRYTGKGENQSPPLKITGIDPLAETIAIITDDPDIPIPFLTFTHWVVYNIPADIAEIHENVPHDKVIPSMGGAVQGKNGFGRIGYTGPNPPFGTHTYRFIVYTLDVVLDLKPGAGRKQLEKAMAGHILQTGMLEGKYGS